MCEELTNQKCLVIYEIKKQILGGGAVANSDSSVIPETAPEAQPCSLKCQAGLPAYSTMYAFFCIKSPLKPQSFSGEKILSLGPRVLGKREGCAQ